jgi:hypothetical protein
VSGEDYSRISVGGLSVGVIGLKAAIEEVKSLRGRGDEEIATALLERLAESNYIPSSAEADYRRAFLREWKRAMGEKVSEEPGALGIKILGPGCPSCHSLERMVMALLSELKLGADVEHVTGRAEIAALGVFATPGLVINGEVRAAGKLPTRATLRHWLLEAAGGGPQSE